MAATSFYPADVVKTYLIIEKNNKKIGISNLASGIIKKHGILGFYKGLGTTAAGVTPFVAFRMATYEFLAHDKKMKEMNPFKGKPGAAEIQTSVSGILAAFVAISISYPFDPVRRLMQLNGSSKEHNYKNAFDLCSRIYKKDGFTGFYRGYRATLVKSIPTNAILFLMNEKLKQNFVNE